MNDLGFYKKRLSIFEIIILILLLVFEIALLFRSNDGLLIKVLDIVDSILFVIIWWAPITTPLSDRFRNIIFLISWIVICILWIIYKSDFITSILPSLILVYTQIYRLIFKWIFNVEPVAVLVHWYPINRFSKVENRQSDKRDFGYSLIMFIVGALFSILLARLI